MSSPLWLHEIAETSHCIQNATSLDKLLLVGQLVGVDESTTVLDIGCGKGELLAQWAATFGSRGHGVDASAVFLAAAHERAAGLGVADHVALTNLDAEHFATERCFDVVCCIGASWFAGDLATSLRRMRDWSAPGGTLVLGEPFWRTAAPAQDHRQHGAPFRTGPGLLDVFDELGLDVVELVASEQDDWDRYRAAQWANLYRWLEQHPDDERGPIVRARLTAHRRYYLSVEREQLGWGMFVLRPRIGR